MNYVFVSFEEGSIPSGVVRVIEQKCLTWGSDDRIAVLLNKNHWAFGKMQTLAMQNKNLTCHRLPFPLTDEIRERLGLTKSSKLVRITSRIAFIPITIILFILTVTYFVAFANRQTCDVLISHNGGWPAAGSNRWVVFAAWIARIKKRILVVHNTPLRPSRWYKPIYRVQNATMMWLATNIVTVSASCAKSLTDIAFCGYNVEVVYNGQDACVFTPPQVPAPFESGPGPVIGFVGEIAHRKGVHVLVEALQKVPPPWHLVLVGSGDDRYETQIHEAAENLAGKVSFMGYRNDAVIFYPHFDMVVLPSVDFESFGLVLLEGMRAAKPTICSDFGGMKEVVVDGETGILVPAGDSDRLAKAIVALLSDPNLCARMGAAGEVRARTVFSAQTMVKGYQDISKMEERQQTK